MIDLNILIQTAPFPKDSQDELLKKVDSLSESEKFELTNLCWALISQDYQNRLQSKFQAAMIEMAQRQKKYSQEDFQKMEEELFTELANRLNITNTKEELEEVREKIQTQQNPLPNP